MANKRHAVRAGLFMILSLAGAIAVIIGIAGPGIFTGSQTRRVAFSLADNVGGLRQGDDVRLGGLKVGKVTEIQYEKKDALGEGLPPADGIVVWMQLPTDYVLAVDAKVGIETSLTGTTWINISDLGTGLAMAEGGVLIGHPDGLLALKTSLGDLGPKFNADLDKIHETLEKYDTIGTTAGADVHDLAGDLHTRLATVSTSASNALDSIHGWFGPTQGDFKETVANVRAISADLKEKTPTLTTSAQKVLDQANDAFAKAQGAIDDLKVTAANAKDITASARSIVVRNQGRVDEIVEELKKTADDIKATIVEVRSSPWRLLYKPTADEMANLNLYDAARQFAEGANNLNDTAVALRDALKDQQADPAKVQKLYDDLIDQFGKFHDTEDALWKKVQE